MSAPEYNTENDRAVDPTIADLFNRNLKDDNDNYNHAYGDGYVKIFAWIKTLSKLFIVILSLKVNLPWCIIERDEEESYDSNHMYSVGGVPVPVRALFACMVYGRTFFSV
jgi:hypothetical protein